MVEFLLDPIFLTLAVVYLVAALLVFGLCRAAARGDELTDCQRRCREYPCGEKPRTPGS